MQLSDISNELKAGKSVVLDIANNGLYYGYSIQSKTIPNDFICRAILITNDAIIDRLFQKFPDSGYELIEVNHDTVIIEYPTKTKFDFLKINFDSHVHLVFTKDADLKWVNKVGGAIALDFADDEDEGFEITPSLPNKVIALTENGTIQVKEALDLGQLD